LLRTSKGARWSRPGVQREPLGGFVIWTVHGAVDRFVHSAHRPIDGRAEMPKRARVTADAAKIAAWLHETEEAVHGGGADADDVDTRAPAAPKWPAACTQLAAAVCEQAAAPGAPSLDAGLAALRALRLSLSLDVGIKEWRAWAEGRLEHALSDRSVAAAVGQDVKSFHSEMRAAGAAGVALLRQLSALDRLDAALWDLARRRTAATPVSLPVRRIDIVLVISIPGLVWLRTPVSRTDNGGARSLGTATACRGLCASASISRPPPLSGAGRGSVRSGLVGKIWYSIHIQPGL